MMSTAQRRRGQSLHLDLPNGVAEELPPVVAVFLIQFDVKAGYMIAWKKSIDRLELNESVEYKSLPSGLHNVEEDLIYFVHDENYAGISAFMNKPAEESERNALMLAVGALVPLSYGRLGKSWKHALGLKELAKKLSQNPENTQSLEDFWTAHQLRDREESLEQTRLESPLADKAKRRQSQPSPNGQIRSRKRAATSASALAPPGQSLGPHHPALSLPTFLDTFGPLVFPLYKAALLRKRILLVGQAPVELACNFVYDISILSGIPSSVSELLPLEPLPTRLRSLFSVGVHDMSILSTGSRNQTPNSTIPTEDMGYGWVANTTDDVLSLKPHLYDTLISLPPSHTKQAKEKHWPRLSLSKGTEVKATQRDLRRYRTLRRELRRFDNHPSPQQSTPSPAPSSLPFENTQETYDEASSTLDAQLAEPQSWSALAYNSFMWWASAGEKRTDLDEEEEYDAALLQHFDTYRDDSPSRPRSARSARKSPGRSPRMDAMDKAPAGLEMRIIAYFHRLTTLILKTLSDIIDAADYADNNPYPPNSNHDTNNEHQPLTKAPTTQEDADADEIFISSEDMSRMGLDIWSESDRDFVRELVALYWGRRVNVRSGKVECCGVRIY